MTAARPPYHSTLAAAHTGFGQLLHAEWTKLRTVRSWMVAAVLAALVMVLFSWFVANGNHASVCSGPPPGTCHGQPALPVGPGGEAVADSYYFVHQPLAGNGSITVRVTSLTGLVSTGGNAVRAGSDPLATTRPDLAPWAKAGLLVTPSLTPGSAYAAVVATGSHGVRMQNDYTHDTPGLSGAVSATSPRWLRLTRSGDSITGAESTDGVDWTTISTAHLAGLPSTVQVGLFVTSPTIVTTTNSSASSYATAVFDHLSLDGAQSDAAWTGVNVGGQPDYPTLAPGSSHLANGRYTVSGSGDIAPAVGGAGGGASTGTTGLIGAFAALIVVAILAALFITAEYRRGLIRTTLAATPARGRVLAAKAIVIGTATFIPGLIGAVAALAVSRRVLVHNGNALFPISTLTEIRVIVGTAALIAVTAVLALAVGTILRRGAGAVAFVVAAIVVPFMLALTPSLSGGVGEWLLRLTPAAGFAVQQQLTHYAQVANAYTPANGYYPLPPWAGFAVLCAWTAIALSFAHVVLRRRDA
jgi:ABC-type transport system involved in multi-copper enzyme maturation permease subunit